MVDNLFFAFSPGDQAMIVEAYQMTYSQLKEGVMPPYESTDARHKYITMAVALDKFLLVSEREARTHAAV
jgi:hypothetical protein